MTPIRAAGLLSLFAILANIGDPSTTVASARSRATETIAIRVHEGTTLAFDVSPDGRTIVFDLLGQLWEMPREGGDARPLTNAVADVAEDLDPCYSPDGKRIVFRGERRGRIGLWLLEPGGAPLQLTQLEDPDSYEGGVSWSPDGRSIVFTRRLPPDKSAPRGRTRLMSIDLATRESRELPIPDAVGPRFRDPAWEPGGKRVAVVAALAGSPSGGRLWLVEAGTARATPVTPEGTDAIAPAFSPDGRRLAFFAPGAARRTQVWVMPVDSAGATPVRLTDHADVAATRVRWTPDGSHVIYSADGRLWSAPVEGGAPAEIPVTVSLSFDRPRTRLAAPHFPEPGTPQTVRAFMGLALSPDARNVAMLALGKLWVMPVGGTPRAVVDVPMSAQQLAWSPDGATLAWSAGPWREEDLFAADLATGSIRRITSLPGREAFPAYAPDGHHLAFVHEPKEETTILRVVETGAPQISDVAQGQALAAEGGTRALWTPDSTALLSVTGGFSPREPTKAVIIPLSGERKAIARIPDSPLFLQWAANSLVYGRHARLWRAPFDATGMLGNAEPLGAEPAMYSSVSREGTVLYISAGGLRLRSPDGRERVLGWPLSYTPPVAEPTLIRNARIIDGTGKPATPPRDLLIQRGRISQVAPAGTLSAGATHILDAEGRFVIPGLMDLHAHVPRPDLLAGFPYFGVTTIRDQGSPIGPLVAYADAIAAGQSDGPRVDYGGFQFYSDWAYDTDEGHGIEPEADANHVARAVEIALALGSQHLKARTFRRWDINARFIAEAHRRGMRVTGHCAHLLPLVAAGMDAKEHAGFCDPRSDGVIYDDLVQLYRAAHIAVVPTVAYSSFAVNLSEHPDLLAGDADLAPFLPPPSAFAWMLKLEGRWRQEFTDFARFARQATAKLARAGVTIGTGTDIWQIPTGVHMELEELVASGLTPLDAIRAATGDAARILGAEDLGTIAAGKWADLIILDGDPVIDIRNSRRIRAVLQAGHVLDRAALVARLHRQ
ncbi:MAG: amidohydrolase family protein [Acidobacteriota bacterium]